MLTQWQRHELSMPDYSEHTSKTRSMGFNRTSMDMPVAMLPNTVRNSPVLLKHNGWPDVASVFKLFGTAGLLSEPWGTKAGKHPFNHFLQQVPLYNMFFSTCFFKGSGTISPIPCLSIWYNTYKIWYVFEWVIPVVGPVHSWQGLWSETKEVWQVLWTFECSWPCPQQNCQEAGKETNWGQLTSMLCNALLDSRMLFMLDHKDCTAYGLWPHYACVIYTSANPAVKAVRQTISSIRHCVKCTTANPTENQHLDLELIDLICTYVRPTPRRCLQPSCIKP